MNTPRNVGGRPGYSAAEDAALRALFPSASRSEILEALPGHSWHHLQKAAERRGLKRERRAQNAKWDGRPMQVLRARYPLGGARAVAAELGPAFTLCCIRLAASRAGLRYQGPITPPTPKPPIYSAAEERAIRRLWPAAPQAKVLAALPGRTWPQLRHWAYRQGLKRAAPRANAAKPKPVKAAKPKAVKPPKPAKVAKPQPAPKAVPVPKLTQHDPMPKAKNTLKPLHVVGAATKADPRTPVLNASKAIRQRAEKGVKAASILDQLRALPYTHPARLAYTRAAAQGGAAAQEAFRIAMSQAA